MGVRKGGYVAPLRVPAVARGSHPTLQLTSPHTTGAAVSHLQCLLHNYWGFTSLAIDGDFGIATNNAVVSFQTSQGLTADGIVGTNTWNALHEVGD